MKKKVEKAIYIIRKGDDNDLYIGEDGEWGTLENASKFTKRELLDWGGVGENIIINTKTKEFEDFLEEI